MRTVFKSFNETVLQSKISKTRCSTMSKILATLKLGKVVKLKRVIVRSIYCFITIARLIFAIVRFNSDDGSYCELCELYLPIPVTYHMRLVHPGCGKRAKGKGYNSVGTYCEGWAGNCGDGGRGASSWYLMCESCHEK